MERENPITMCSKRATVIALVLTLMLAAAQGITAAPPQAKQKLVIAIQPTFNVAEMQDKAKPMEAYLEQKLGDVDVEIYVPLSQAGVVEALRFGHAQVAFLGPWTAELAVNMAGAELALAEIREVSIDGKKINATYYFSDWIVMPASPYKSLAELKGKRACFPSPVSGSGFVAPMGKLVQLGLLQKNANGEADPKQFFGEVLFAGGYGQCWQSLKSGQVDVAVMAGDVPEALYKDVMASTHQIEKQGPLPSHSVVIARQLQEPLRGRVIAAIAGLGAPEHRALMRQFISGIFVGFEPSNAARHLGAFRDYLALSGLQFTERINRR